MNHASLYAACDKPAWNRWRPCGNRSKGVFGMEVEEFGFLIKIFYQLNSQLGSLEIGLSIMSFNQPEEFRSIPKLSTRCLVRMRSPSGGRLVIHVHPQLPPCDLSLIGCTILRCLQRGKGSCAHPEHSFCCCSWQLLLKAPHTSTRR